VRLRPHDQLKSGVDMRVGFVSHTKIVETASHYWPMTAVKFAISLFVGVGADCRRCLTRASSSRHCQDANSVTA
jgi:hypothetical protein